MTGAGRAWAGFRRMEGDIYMDLGGLASEVRLWSFCVCGGVVGSTRCSLKWGFSCRNLGSLLVVCVAQKWQTLAMSSKADRLGT